MNPPPVRLAAVILAGGASRRMGSPKPLLDWGGQTILDRLITLFAAHCRPVVAVLGHHSATIQAGLDCASLARIVVNPRPERGQLSSLQCGLAAITEPVDGFFFTPADYPALRQATIERLAEAFRRDRPLLAVPSHQGRRGHPVCAAAVLIPEFLALPEDAQARDVVRRHRGGAISVDVDDPGILRDVDEPDDLRRLREAAQTP